MAVGVGDGVGELVKVGVSVNVGVGVDVEVGVDAGAGVMVNVGVDVGVGVSVANGLWIVQPPASRRSKPSKVTKTACRDFACVIRALFPGLAAQRLALQWRRAERSEAKPSTGSAGWAHPNLRICSQTITKKHQQSSQLFCFSLTQTRPRGIKVLVSSLFGCLANLLP